MKGGVRYTAALLLLFSQMLFSSCKKDSEIHEITPALHSVNLNVPGNFPKVENPESNPLTEEGIALGRTLFYDVRLSGSNSISCASCHHQELAFTDALALSAKGVSGKELPRHAPALFNLAWMNNGLFWDGGSTNLESQAFGPLTNPDEMHQDLLQLEAELKSVPEYVARFKQVFHEDIKSANIVKALSQFQRTLISGGSKYDQFIRHENGTVLSELETRGLNLVKSNCISCHSGALFTDNLFHNNGIDADFSNTELEGLYQGRYRISYDLNDLGKFKTPSLRNTAITAPYMHDGRFKTLNDVLDHYTGGVLASASLDRSLIKSNGTMGVNLTPQDKQAIIAFINTLTDHAFIDNKSFGKPASN